MIRIFKMTDKAKQALWSKLSDDSIFIPDSFSVEGDARDGYIVSYVDKDNCGFNLIVSGKKIRSLYAVRGIIEDINTNGTPREYSSLVDCRCFCWSHIPIPLPTL